MTESEALPWSIRRLEESARGVKRNAQRISKINAGALTSEAERATHEHATRVSSAMAQALAAEARKARTLFGMAAVKALHEPLQRDDGD